MVDTQLQENKMNPRDIYPDILKDIKLMQLATVRDKKPWMCNVWYVMDEDHNVYWISRETRRHSLEIKDALDKGAKLHCGGKRPEGLNGAFYEPTILTNITKDMRVWKEEVFGPALPVVSFDTYEEAIEMANDTEYGLSGSVFTNDSNLARKAQLDIKAGSLDHNKAHCFRSQNPFGGYKKSGIGRQQGQAGFEEATQIKVMAREK
jgi:acyl-CoA reductase-like NAD-dependent aldehyde dehydrogenase